MAIRLKWTRAGLVAIVGVLAFTALPTSGQNINIEYSTLLGTPTPVYGAAAGQPGIWNNPTVGTLVAQPLVDINGSPTTATIRMTPANFDLLSNNAGTSGDDEALMDDILNLGSTGPDDFIIEHLSAGTYTVYTYAWAPDSDAFITSVDVNGLGVQNVGGPWPGTQTLGITYAQHANVVVPADGTITISTNVVVSFGSLNGIQLVGGASDQGRCCDLGGGCTITTEVNCVAPSVFGGLGTGCGGDPCRGRCCDPVSGACEVTGPADCGAPNVFGGLGTNCNGDPCSGRCCDASANCTITGPSGCAGAFGGLGTDCSNLLVYGDPNPIPVAMPPAGAAPPSFITVADNFVVTDVDVLVKVQHTYRQDVILQLQGPDGTLVPLTGTTLGICTFEDNINAFFDDEGAAVVCASANLANLNAPPDRIFTNPAGGLGAFDGLPAQGVWTLLASDIITADVGAVLDWALIFEGGSPCPTGGCTCLGDLNGDTFVNGADVSAFSACVIAGGGPGCDCADINQVDGVTAADIGPFITALLNGACP